MHLRLYKFKKKHIRKDGTVTIGPNRQWKWVKGETKQRKYRPRGQAKTLFSKRFGYLEVYTYNERKLLICPSGYTFGQGMHALHRLWIAYKISKSEANIDKMIHYARAIQDVQEDMGLKTTSFPHLGIFGDVLVFRDNETKEMGEEIDHSRLKEKQQLEEERKKFEEIAPLIQKELEQVESLPEPEPEPEPESDILTIADEIPQPQGKYRIKHQNRMHYGKKRDYEWDCEECGERIPANKNHLCEIKPEKESESERIVTFADNIPFR